MEEEGEAGEEPKEKVVLLVSTGSGGVYGRVSAVEKDSMEGEEVREIGGSCGMSGSTVVEADLSVGGGVLLIVGLVGD